MRMLRLGPVYGGIKQAALRNDTAPLTAQVGYSQKCYLLTHHKKSTVSITYFYLGKAFIFELCTATIIDLSTCLYIVLMIPCCVRYLCFCT